MKHGASRHRYGSGVGKVVREGGLPSAMDGGRPLVDGHHTRVPDTSVFACRLLQRFMVVCGCRLVEPAWVEPAAHRSVARSRGRRPDPVVLRRRPERAGQGARCRRWQLPNANGKDAVGLMVDVRVGVSRRVWRCPLDCDGSLATPRWVTPCLKRPSSPCPKSTAARWRSF